MRIPTLPRLVLGCTLLCSITLAKSACAGGVGVSEPSDSVLVDPALRTSGANINEPPFHYYKVPVSRGARANRDYEFLWSDTYRSQFHMPLDSLSGASQINDMDRLGQAVCEIWSNPFGHEMTDIEIAYNYLANRDTLLDALGQPFVRDSLYNSDQEAPRGFRSSVPDYPDAERTHLDAYIYASSYEYFPQHAQWGTYNGDGPYATYPRKNYGLFPSEFTSSKEDSLNGNAQTPRHLNSLMIPGPPPWGVAATHDYRWTGPMGNGNAGLVHESLHALNADGTQRGRSMDFLHMFASGAEVVAGISLGRPWDDFDYTCSLTPGGSSFGPAYPHWQSWMAWLAFNWRGADTTVAGWTDDLVRRWATRPWDERTMIGLANRLRDSECAECAAYPGFAGLDSLSRLQRLLHDWRVALYVNNTALPGGRYGFPPQFGFSPYGGLWAWRGDTKDYLPLDSYSVPPVVPIGAAQRNQELRFTQRPAGPGFEARSLRLNMFGAEYFVFTADASLSATQQKLTVRVHMPGLLKGRATLTYKDGCRTIEYGGQLFASLVTYSQASDSLYLHPEWATSVTTRKAVLDQVNAPLVFDAPGFGAGTKAVVLVVSLEDGPEGGHTTYGIKPQSYHSWSEPYPNTYDFEISAVAHQEVLPDDPLPVAATIRPERATAWSGRGDSLAFEALDAVGHRGVFIAPALNSGAARALQSGTLAQYDPAWSPRDNSVVWAQAAVGGQRHLWRMTASGTAQQLTSSYGAVHEPVFSPNGAQIAYLRYVRTNPPPEDTTIILPPGQQSWVSELRLLTIEPASDVVVATFAGDSAMSNPRWAPDGKRLLFSGTGELANETWHLWQVNMTTWQRVTRDALAPEASGFDLAPGRGPLLIRTAGEYAWQPTNDVGWGYCSSDSTTRRLPVHGFALRDTSGGTQVALAQLTGRLDHVFRYSPDGTKVACVVSHDDNPDVYVASTTFDRAPAFSSSVQTSYSVPSCAPFELILSATDPDGDAITYEVFDLPAGAQLQSGSHVYWAAPVAGQYWLIARALDPAGAVATRLVHLEVIYEQTCGGEGGEDPPPILPGGGNAARQAGDFRLIGGAGPIHAVNTFLDGASPGMWVRQVARLMAPLTDSLGHVSTRIAALRPGLLKLDRARLQVVDHAPGTVAVAAGDGIAVGGKRPAEHLVTDSGEDLSQEFSTSSDGARLFAAGSTLELTWNAGERVDGVALDCARAGAPDEASAWGVRIETRAGESWAAAGHLHPRSAYDMLAVPLETNAPVRLVFVTDTYVREAAGYALMDSPEQAAVVTEVEASGTDVELGVEHLAAADSAAVELAQGQRVTMNFDGPPPVEGRQRTLFLDLVAAVERDGAAATAAGREAVALPARFALHANRPNPFGGGTTFRFDTPRPAHVKLEVFDAQGRRVCTLADRAFEPGQHALAWDGTDSGGQRLRPGVYLYRMSADGFREQRRMVLLGS